MFKVSMRSKVKGSYGDQEVDSYLNIAVHLPKSAALATDYR